MCSVPSPSVKLAALNGIGGAHPMQIIDRQDGADVEEQFKSIFTAELSRAAEEPRKLFVEKCTSSRVQEGAFGPFLRR